MEIVEPLTTTEPEIIENEPEPISEPEIELETVPEIIEEVEIVKSKGPRQAQRIKRRKAIRSKVLSDRETKLAGLAALNSDKEIENYHRQSRFQKRQ